jgi:DNA-binding helix-hairpin-helix protein with protein kinase domain
MNNEEEKEEESLTVIDMENRVFHTSSEIGHGGQGIVYHVKDDMDIAVKIAIDFNGAPVVDHNAIKEVSERLNNIRRLPIPKDINLSQPLSILKSHAGYVMTFMKGMKSFESFLKLKEKVKEIPSWLCNGEGKPVENAELWANYCISGGLRTRLIALYKISELLASLHMNGLVYGDISAGNLMYKKEGENISGGLIDADNINFAGKGKTYYTPGYGAPEIITGQNGATIFSDSYAFAVAAFFILTMMHPYKGEKVLGVNSEDDDDWAKTVTVQAQKDTGDFKDDGRLPWIFDQEDDSNSFGSFEQVMELFLTPELMALFDNTFRVGHTKPELRTPLIRWPLAFARAADKTIRCSSCGMTYYYSEERDECPYCSGKTGDVLKVTTNKANGEKSIFVHELSDEQEVEIPSRCFEPFRIGKGDESVIGLKKKGNTIEIIKLNDSIVPYIVFDDGEEETLIGKRVLNKSTAFTVFYKDAMSEKVRIEVIGE